MIRNAGERRPSRPLSAPTLKDLPMGKNMLLLCLLAAAAAGCGDPGPQLDDAAQHFIAAQKALAEGDKTTAMQELDTSIAARPDPWAYYGRAELHADAGDDAAAKADCEAGLKLAPEHADLKWLAGELQKPARKRFKGKAAQPPSDSK